MISLLSNSIQASRNISPIIAKKTIAPKVKTKSNNYRDDISISRIEKV